MKYGRIISLSLFCLFWGILCAQKFPEKGLPLLHNFTPEDYGEVGKAWAIKSAANGLVYFATDKGLLEFDGEVWQHFRGSKGFSRSLLITNDSVWYTGADKDFGRWQKADHQQLQYQSLYPYRKSTKGLNEEFWGVYQLDDDIVFVSFNNIYILKDGHLTKIAAPYRFYKSYQTSSGLYVSDDKYGLYHFDGLNLKAVFSYPPAEKWYIVGLSQTDQGLLVVTSNRGLYLYRDGQLQALSNEINDYLRRDQVFSFTPIEDGHYAFGTILNGVYITDREGRITQHLNKQKGLPNNTILGLHYSPLGTLWLSMDYGISALNLSSRTSYVLDQRGAFGTGQAAAIQGGTFYLGTNQGLYQTDWENGLKNDANGISLELLPESTGQVWALENINGTIWCGHDHGLFRVEHDKLSPVATTDGVFAITPIDEEHLLTGTYNGVSLFQRDGQNWSFVRKLSPIQGACSQLLMQADSVLWVNIPNYGLIKAKLDDQFMITKQRIFRTETFTGAFPTLYQDSMGIHLRTDKQEYHYHLSRDSFLLNPNLPNLPEIAHRLPENHLGLSLNDTFDFYPVYNGFALFNKTAASPKVEQPALLLRELTAFNNDTTLHFQQQAVLPYRLNNIRVHFRVPQHAQITYRYKLVNYQDDWSEWSPRTKQDFLHLPEGGYELLLEARTAKGTRLQAVGIRFAIAPPWYRKWYAYLAYALGIFGIFYGQRLRQNAKLARQKAQLQAQERRALQQQAEAFEQAKLVQQNQNLEVEISGLQKQLRAKTIELAKKAKENEDKNRLLQALKKKIDSVEVRSTEAKLRWAEMSRLLDAKMPMEDHTFEMQMDELHQDFLRQLKARFPKLTTYDLRLATYLKTGLSSREIADIMNVLPSSVNVSRSRLRKKLELDPEEDLYEFLNGISQAKG